MKRTRHRHGERRSRPVLSLFLSVAFASPLAAATWTTDRVLTVPALSNDVGSVTLDVSNRVVLTTRASSLGAGVDQLLHYHAPLGPTGSIAARISAPAAPAGALTAAGLMLRASGAPDAARAAAHVVSAALPSPYSGFAFSARPADRDDAPPAPWAAGPSTLWIRIDRAGDAARGYTSSNGTNWTLHASAAIALPATARIGPFACNDDLARSVAFVFELRLVDGADPAADTDGDGMPDAFELHFGLDPWIPDADADADGDGVPNGQDARPNDPDVGRIAVVITHPPDGSRVP